MVAERLRARPPERIEGERVRGRAAVAAILRERAPGAPEVLFIRRAEKPGDPWSGHMAFPGGKQEPGDPDLTAFCCFAAWCGGRSSDTSSLWSAKRAGLGTLTRTPWPWITIAGMGSSRR
ncbi:MAG: NUDIX domain-containing protein [Deltaproteobacteria bacterium]